MTEETQYQQVDLNDLEYFWLPNGAPCFVGNREDICDQVEGLGFQIYYLIANQEIVVNTSNNNNNAKNKTAASVSYQQTKYKGKILKVVKNIVGRAVSAADEDFGKDLLSFKEEAEYSLPPIPKAMVDKLDEFFRLVHAQHGTESIVMLTFDPTKEGSDGWGILVPEQTNTAAHCKYDPDSVASLKEDHVLIVGSVHSHPEMSAYASGTDHEDQADFDGLHITYGWQKHVSNGMTQYHAELQMGGSNYILDIDDIFESFTIEKNPDPEVIEWTEKVKKSQAPALGAFSTTQYGTTTPTTTYSSSGTTTMGYPGTTNSNYAGYDSGRFVQKRQQNIPAEILDSIPYNAVLIAEIDTSELGRMLCPSCGLSLFKNEIYLGSSCPSCDIPLIGINSHIDSIVKTANAYQNKRNRNCNVPYYLWSKGSSNGKQHTILLIKEEAELFSSVKGDDNLKAVTYKDSDQVKLPTDDDDSVLQYDLRKEFEEKIWNDYDNGDLSPDIHFLLEYWSTRTWCCEKDIISSNQAVCDCKIMITDEDAADYDEFCSKNNLTVYQSNSDCEVCVHYYGGSCNGYRQGVVDYKNSEGKPLGVIIDHIEQNLKLDGCIQWERYPNDFSHIETIEMESYDNTY